MADDTDTVITIDAPRRQTKDEQLAEARKKAVISRRRRQKANLEDKIRQIKLMLGEIDEDKMEHIIQVMLDRESDLRSKHTRAVAELNETLRRLDGKSVQEGKDSAMARKVDAIAEEVRLLREAITKKRSLDDRASTTTKTTTLSDLSSLAAAHHYTPSSKSHVRKQ